MRCTTRSTPVRGAGERVESALREGQELILSVPVREHGEHEVVQPVVDGLVEGAQDARLVRVAAPALQERLRFLAPVAAEVAVEQVDHGPQVAAFLHVHLEEIAQVVEAGRGLAQEPLLLDARGLGVALGHDEAAQRVAVLAGDDIPGRLAHHVAKSDPAIRGRVGQEDPPPVLGHLHVVELGPAVGVHAGGGAEPDLFLLEPLGTHLLPPIEVVGLPLLEGPQQPLVLREVDVVRDSGAEIDVRHAYVLVQEKRGRSGLP